MTDEGFPLQNDGKTKRNAYTHHSDLGYLEDDTCKTEAEGAKTASIVVFVQNVWWSHLLLEWVWQEEQKQNPVDH